MQDLEIVVGTGPEMIGERYSAEQVHIRRFKQSLYERLALIPCLFKQIFQCALVAALAYGSYWFFSKHVLQSVEVVGVSMVPTLRHSQHYILDRWTYLLRDPQPNDIVVLRDPEDNNFAVKRIIGRQGDSIQIKGGQVFINDRLLDEPYLKPGTRTYSFLTKSGDQWAICGKDQFFVMGDNRGNSEDSRIYGPIPRESILGMILH